MRTRFAAALIFALLAGCDAQIDDSPARPAPAAVTPPAAVPPAVQPPALEPPPAQPPPVEPPVVPPPPTQPPPLEPPPTTPPPAATGSLALSVPSTSMTLHLNEAKSVKLTVTPKNGFAGTATFSVAGLPVGVTATFNPASVPLTTAPVDVTLTLRAVSELMGTLGMPLTISTTSCTISSSTPLTLDLLQEVLITIAPGVNLGTAAAPNTTAFGAVSTSIIFVNPGTKVTFINMDSRTHEIHANTNTVGLKHEQGTLMPNGANSYSQILTKGSVSFRCHIHPNMLGQIVVK